MNHSNAPIARLESATSAALPTLDNRKAMLQLRAVGKHFGAVRVLKGIDLTVHHSEVVCLIGPSGSGKSTLLRSMAFLEEYDEGQIHIEGQLLGWQAAESSGKTRRRAPQARINQVRQNVGMVFQQFNLWPHMTALGNVCSRCASRARRKPANAAWRCSTR
jgi:polar amino acid transport system ATP-binding protein